MTVADEENTVPFEQKGAEGIRLDRPPTAEELTAWKLTYFGNRLCPFAHRTWFAMHEKGVTGDFGQYVHVELGEKKPVWYKDKVNPFGTVPCIYEGTRGVFESAVCVEYLDEKFAGRGTPLFPGDAVTRAAVRALVSSLDVKPLYAFLMEQDRSKDETHKAALATFMAAIEAKYTAQSADGPYFLGAELSAADIALFPFIDRMQPALLEYRGYDLWGGDTTPYPHLKAAWDAVQSRPGWIATRQSADYYVAVYQGYATGKPGTVPLRIKAKG